MERPADLPAHLSISLSEGLGVVRNEEQEAHECSTWNKFSLRTTDAYYAVDSEERARIEALGFRFQPIGSPFTVVKSANPVSPLILQSIPGLMAFIEKHGAVAITPDREIIILGGHAHHLPCLSEVGKPSEGYTSVGGNPA